MAPSIVKCPNDLSVDAPLIASTMQGNASIQEKLYLVETWAVLTTGYNNRVARKIVLVEANIFENEPVDGSCSAETVPHLEVDEGTSRTVVLLIDKLNRLGRYVQSVRDNSWCMCGFCCGRVSLLH
jgi:hypothetical protein